MYRLIFSVFMLQASYSSFATSLTMPPCENFESEIEKIIWVNDQFQRSDIVMSGFVQNSNDGQNSVFDVHKVWKGTVGRKPYIDFPRSDPGAGFVVFFGVREIENFPLTPIGISCGLGDSEIQEILSSVIGSGYAPDFSYLENAPRPESDRTSALVFLGLFIVLFSSLFVLIFFQNVKTNNS